MTQMEEKTVQVTRKSGKGLRDGVVSELATFWDVIPGHEAELKAACDRLATTLKNAPIELNMQTGLRDERHVLFDGGKRLMWCTTFESDWDPYVEDSIVRIGLDNFTDWVQHLTAVDRWWDWIREAGGEEPLRAAPGITDPGRQKEVRMSLSGLKTFLQSGQAGAVGYFNAMSDLTMPEIRKAVRLNQVFQQVLDDPDAAEALQHPALKPLLELAAD